MIENKKGVSLIELMVAIAIIGILAVSFINMYRIYKAEMKFEEITNLIESGENKIKEIIEICDDRKEACKEIEMNIDLISDIYTELSNKNSENNKLFTDGYFYNLDSYQEKGNDYENICGLFNIRKSILKQSFYIRYVNKINGDNELKEENKEILGKLNEVKSEIETNLKEYFTNTCTNEKIEQIEKENNLTMKIERLEDITKDNKHGNNFEEFFGIKETN